MYRILLVDDEILVRDAIKENIDWKSLDCELVGDCENGKQASEFVKEHPVDIVLTDILMPYMDGMELSKFLHDNYPDVVIVIFSGFGEFEYAKKAIQYGVSEYLLKPVTAMELTGVINKMKEKVDQLRREKNKMNKLTYNISDEIVTREEAGFAYQEGNNRVGILFQEKWSRNFTEKTREICREIQDKTKEVMGFDVSMGIGKWVKKPEELVQSHNMAQDTLQYRYLLGGNLLIDMEEKHPVQEISIDEPLSVLKEALKTGQEDLVFQTLVSIEDLIRNALMQKSRACMYLQQVIRTMDNACEDVSADMEQIRGGRDELICEITDQKFFGEACEVVARHTKRVISILSAMNTSSSERQARLAIDYIQKNYMVPDLSLNSICSYLNISTSYFSTIFKEETGETFTEVLIRTRMEKAKELLENTTMKNYEIAEKVGFSDPHYFGISFKKMTGCTPTEYAREKRR